MLKTCALCLSRFRPSFPSCTDPPSPYQTRVRAYQAYGLSNRSIDLFALISLMFYSNVRKSVSSAPICIRKGPKRPTCWCFLFTSIGVLERRRTNLHPAARQKVVFLNYSLICYTVHLFFFYSEPALRAVLHQKCATFPIFLLSFLH